MVAKLARLTDKDAVFNLAETALVDHHAEGEEVIVWPLSNPQLTIEGVVREVAPVADSTTRTYTVKVTLKDPPSSILFGMSIGGRWKGSSALLVALPLSVLFEKDGAPAVWVFDQQSGSATLKSVTVARYEAEPRPRARHQLAILEPDHQCCAVGDDRDPGARRHLPGRCCRARRSQ